MSFLAISNHYSDDGKHKAIVYKSMEDRSYSVFVEGETGEFSVPFNSLSDAEDFAEDCMLQRT